MLERRQDSASTPCYQSRCLAPRVAPAHLLTIKKKKKKATRKESKGQTWSLWLLFSSHHVDSVADAAHVGKEVRNQLWHCNLSTSSALSQLQHRGSISIFPFLPLILHALTCGCNPQARPFCCGSPVGAEAT